MNWIDDVKKERRNLMKMITNLEDFLGGKPNIPENSIMLLSKQLMIMYDYLNILSLRVGDGTVNNIISNRGEGESPRMDG